MHRTQAWVVLNVFMQPAYRGRALSSTLMQNADAKLASREITFAVLHATEVSQPIYGVDR